MHVQVQVWARNNSSVVNSMGKLIAPDTEKRIEKAIKRYTRHSNAQRVIEQKDLLI